MVKLGIMLAMASIVLNPAVRAADFNGDGMEEVFIFRSSTGLWAVRGVTRLYFGGEGDTAVPGDYDGSGTARPAVFRPGSGLWAVRGLTRIYFGEDNDQPEPGDYSGAGTDHCAIFRPATGLWAVRGVTRAYFGREGDDPVPGDYDGRGRILPAIFRPPTGLWAARGLARIYFGGTGDTPFSGSYDGSGFDRPAVFRPGNGLWAVWGLTRFYFGESGDQPQPGDYTGNGRDEFMIFRPATGLWAARGWTRFYFGGQPATAPTPSSPSLQWRDGYDMDTLSAPGGEVEFWTRNIQKPTGPNTSSAPHEYIITRVIGEGIDRLLIMSMYERDPRIHFEGDGGDTFQDGLFSQPLPGPSHWRVASDRTRLWIELDGEEIWSRSGSYYIEQAIMGGYPARGFLGEWSAAD